MRIETHPRIVQLALTECLAQCRNALVDVVETPISENLRWAG